MSLTVSRFTAVLAALALIAVAGTFWWAIHTRSEIKAAVASRQERPPQKFAGRAGRDPPTADAGVKPGYELAGRSVALAVDTAAPGAPAPGSAAPQGPASPPPASQGPASPGAEASDSASHSLRGLELPPPMVAALPTSGSADMPLPTLLPPPVQSDPLPAPAKLTEPPPTPTPTPSAAAVVPPTPPTTPPDTMHRRARASVAPAPKRPVTYYMEKYFELGEYHYRRRPCEPPNMPDVCFMPQNDREPIVVVSKP